MINSTGLEARLPECKCTFGCQAGLNSVPPKLMSIWNLGMNVTLFGNKVLFADVIKVRQGHPYIQYDWYPYKKKKIWTQRQAHTYEDRDWSDASTSQRIPRIAGNHLKQGDEKLGTNSPQSLQEGLNLADPSVLDF